MKPIVLMILGFLMAAIITFVVLTTRSEVVGRDGKVYDNTTNTPLGKHNWVKCLE